MKLGIITYHRSINYGAQLQAYALSKVLSKLGHQAEIIDCNTIGCGNVFHWNFKSLRGFLGACKNNALSLLSEFKRRAAFSDFVENYIPKSKECTTTEALNSIVNEYDYIITGSDQVWHPLICEGKKLFFLDLPIPSEKKIAYAPSFGVTDYTKEEVIQYIPLIKDIKHLSVRETTGNRIINKYMGKAAVEVVDPTILLNSRDWNDLTSPPKYKKYLLYFTILDEPLGLDEAVRKYAYDRRLKILRIGSVRDILKKDFINVRASGPKEFLSLVRYADSIVTSSFHGLVFSILFHKDFFCVLNNNERNSRLIDLAEKLGVTSRIITDINSLDNHNETSIDYNDVELRLSAMRESSFNFIKNAIQ